MPKSKEHLPKYVHRKKTPSERKDPKSVGKLYFIRRGLPSAKFDCQDPNDPEFMMEYALYLNGKKQRLARQSNAKTLAVAIQRYIESAEYEKLAYNTAKDYDKVLTYLKRDFGHTKPTEWTRGLVKKVRDANIKQRRFADYIVQVSRLVFEQCIDLGWMNYNPSSKIKPLPKISDPRLPWPDALVTEFRNVAKDRTLLAFELLIGTGQRVGDVREFEWKNIRPIHQQLGIDLIQNKTQKPLWVPLPDRCVQLLTIERNKKRNDKFVLVNREATAAWSYKGISDAILKIRRQIGAEAYDIHSLRYNAACELAMAGCSDHEIGSITGQHEQTVKHYTKSVRQAADAKRAFAARERLQLENGT